MDARSLFSYRTRPGARPESALLVAAASLTLASFEDGAEPWA